jgi:ribosomal protein L17
MIRTTHCQIKILRSIIKYEIYFAKKYLKAYRRYKFDDISDKVRFKLLVSIKRKYEEMCGEEYGKNMSRQNEKNLKRLSLYVYTKFIH